HAPRVRPPGRAHGPSPDRLYARAPPGEGVGLPGGHRREDRRRPRGEPPAQARRPGRDPGRAPGRLQAPPRPGATSFRRALAALRPRSYRARIAVALALALVVAVVGMQFAFRTLVVDRLNASVSANLRQQAQAVALEVQQLNIPAAIDAARYLPDTSII